jgi:hypothetical protein
MLSSPSSAMAICVTVRGGELHASDVVEWSRSQVRSDQCQGCEIHLKCAQLSLYFHTLVLANPLIGLITGGLPRNQFPIVGYLDQYLSGLFQALFVFPCSNCSVRPCSARSRISFSFIPAVGIFRRLLAFASRSKSYETLLSAITFGLCW